MTTDFDAMKAIREEIAGINEVRSVMIVRERTAEEALGKAESELNAYRKLRGWVDGELNRKRGILAELERKAEGR